MGTFARTNNHSEDQHFCLISFSVFLQDTFDAAKKSFGLIECHKKQNIEMPESICHQYCRIK